MTALNQRDTAAPPNRLVCDDEHATTLTNVSDVLGFLSSATFGGTALEAHGAGSALGAVLWMCQDAVMHVKKSLDTPPVAR